MFRSLQRNLFGTSLTYLAIFVLVFMVTSILSVLNFIDNITAAKEGNQKAIITEKFQNPSGMSRDMPKQIWKIATSLPEKYQPRSYRVAKFVKENNIRRPEDLFTQLPADLKPKTLDEARDLFQMQETDDMMTWAFIAGSLEQDKITFESLIIAFCMEPRKLKTMMPGLEDLSIEELRLLEKAIAVMEEKPNSIIMGKQRLKTTRKQVGDKIQIYCKNYKGLVFDCEIIGELPEGRWDQFSAINLKFLLDKLDWFEKSNPDNPSHAYHENAPKVIGLVWLRMPDMEAFQHMAEIVNEPKTFNIAVKMETESSAYGSFLDAYKSLLWGMRWLMVPAILGTMTLVIANAISISVRERRTEMAVLKVLGFRPRQVMFMVLGEALLIGLLGGLLSAGGAYVLVKANGGIPFPIAFFSKFFIAASSALWGLSFGVITAFLGSIMPAWSAQSVKAAEVFSKVV